MTTEPPPPIVQRIRRWGLVVLGCGLLAYVLTSGSRGGPDVGEPAEAFTARVLGSEQGFQLSARAGHTTVLDFWATWCPPCRRSLPVLQRLHDTYRGTEVSIVGVNTDSGAGRVSLVRRFMNGHRFTFPVILDEGEVSRLYRVKSIPLLVIVGPDGTVQHVEVGVRGSPEDHFERLSRLIEATRAAGGTP